jgi:hypothetical protein
VLLGTVSSQSANSHDIAPRAPHVGLAVPGPRAHAKAPEDPAVRARAVATVHLGPMTRAGSLGRCHAACAHSLAGELPSAIGRRCAARHLRLRAHAGALVGHEGRAKPPRRIIEPIKPLPLLSSRATGQTPQSAAAAISAADELAPPLAPVTNP